jgi:hypothetical protein
MKGKTMNARIAQLIKDGAWQDECADEFPEFENDNVWESE